MRERLLKILRNGVPGFREDQPLHKQIDSLALINLVGELEKEFGVSIASMELVPSTFESVEAIEALLARKRGGG